MIPKISAKKVARGQVYRIKKSPVKRSTKRIPQRNPKRIAKRKVAYRKMLAGKEYKEARAEAMARAGNRCEGMAGNFPDTTMRCEGTENLHAHHLRYPKTRTVEARDLQILCPWHHWEAERNKMHKTRMF